VTFIMQSRTPNNTLSQIYMFLKSIFIDPLFQRRYNPVMSKSQDTEKPYFLPKIKVARPNNGLSDGSFASVTSKGSGTINYNDFIHCRETFQGRSMDKMLFSHSDKVSSETIAEFIHLVEQRLNHKNITHIAPTNINKITYIEPAQFWLFKPMRQSLFTALLRAACNYTGNFDKALYSINYLNGTKKAVSHFLDGNTWYKGNSSGWFNAFRNQKDLTTVLGKKPIPKAKFTEFVFSLLGKEPEAIKKSLEKKPITQEDLLDHALSLLKMKPDSLTTALKKARTSDAVIEREALKELGKNKNEIEKDYRRRNFTHSAKAHDAKNKEKAKTEDKKKKPANPERRRRRTLRTK